MNLMRHLSFGIVRIGAALLLTTLSGALHAFSSGSIVCSVGLIPFSPMSSTLSSPTPTGWSLLSDARFYQPGALVQLRIINTDVLKKVKGVLLWAQFDDFATPAGSFLIGPGTPWKYVAPSPSAQCLQGSLTHENPTPKMQAELSFNWTAPASGKVYLQAFLIEDCVGNCRSNQALTQTIELFEAISINGFE